MQEGTLFKYLRAVFILADRQLIDKCKYLGQISPPSCFKVIAKNFGCNSNLYRTLKEEVM